MPITIEIPTSAQWAQIEADRQKNSPLALWNAANTPKPAVGSPAATTAAGVAGGTPQLNALNNPEWIQSMSEMINQINLKAQQEANAARIPGAAGLEQKSSQNIQSALAGEVPNDVYREMAQRSAERGVSTGSPMGANSTADIMRALGLTSLDMTNLGQKQLTEALGRNPSAPLYNPAQLVTSAGDAEKLAIARENMLLDYNARMAAIEAARNRGGGGGGGTGYRLPSGGSGGGTFAPATNWTGGSTTATPWNLPYSLGDQGGITDADWNDLLYGYPGEDLGPAPATNPQGGWGAYDLNPVTYNPNLYPGSGIDQSGLSEEELDWLYNVGG